MARKLRIQYPGAMYHVMNRGDHREIIFRADKDRELFLKTLAQVCTKTDWRVHAWCLMSNHFHLVVETPRANLVEGMKWFLGTYTLRFNRRYQIFGHLFSGRYKALVVDGSGSGYLKSVCDYVHLNPVRARLIGPEEPLESYRWSSYPHYLQKPVQRPAWLSVLRLLGEWGIASDSPAGRQQLALRMEARRQAEQESKFKPTGWCLGSEDFRRELLAQVSQKRGLWHYGAELGESDQAKAEKLISAQLKGKGWKEQELQARRKGDPFKVELALKLRGETTMTIDWIANRLNMGTRGHLTQLLHRSHLSDGKEGSLESNQKCFNLSNLID